MFTQHASDDGVLRSSVCMTVAMPKHFISYSVKGPCYGFSYRRLVHVYFTGPLCVCIYRPLLEVYLQASVAGVFTGPCSRCIYRPLLRVCLQAPVAGVFTGPCCVCVYMLPELMYPSWSVTSDVA